GGRQHGARNRSRGRAGDDRRMTRGIRSAAVAVAIVALALPASAQQHDHAGHSPYAGLQGREIKALDSTAVRDYLAGAGMGFALAAELNGYPGPRHVLELADQLQLTPEQKAATQRI